MTIKTCFTCALLLCISLFSKAQIGLGLGVQLNVPTTGELKYAYNPSPGLEFNYVTDFEKHAQIQAGLGFTIMKPSARFRSVGYYGDPGPIYYANLLIAPLFASLRWSPWTDAAVKPFIGIRSGWYFSLRLLDPDIVGTVSEPLGNRFTFAPQVGVQFKAGERSYLIFDSHFNLLLGFYGGMHTYLTSGLALVFEFKEK